MSILNRIPKEIQETNEEIMFFIREYENHETFEESFTINQLFFKVVFAVYQSIHEHASADRLSMRIDEGGYYFFYDNKFINLWELIVDCEN